MTSALRAARREAAYRSGGSVRWLARAGATLAGVVLALLPGAWALPVVAISGPVPYSFNVDAAHAISDAQTGRFHDVLGFSIASQSSLAVTAMFFNGDVEGFTARLRGPAGPLATGLTVGYGNTPQNPLGFANTIFIGSLKPGEYAIDVEGIDRIFLEESDIFAPYTLTVAAGVPVELAAGLEAASVPEPASIALMLAALIVLVRHRTA